LQMNALQMWHDPIYIVVIAGCLVAALASPIAKKALSSRFMIYSGKISYSIYLLHLPVIVWLDRFTPARNTPEVFLVLTFAITVAVASLTYRFIEQPARQWINETFAGEEPASSADTAESPSLELRQS
jgi:peptidoglycan/LPS O-acetylase OafA/YrhL